MVWFADFEDNDILRFNNTLYWQPQWNQFFQRQLALKIDGITSTLFIRMFLKDSYSRGNRWTNCWQWAVFQTKRNLLWWRRFIWTNLSGYPNSRGSESRTCIFILDWGGLDVSPIELDIWAKLLLSFPGELFISWDTKMSMTECKLCILISLWFVCKEPDSLPVTDGGNSY